MDITKKGLVAALKEQRDFALHVEPLYAQRGHALALPGSHIGDDIGRGRNTTGQCIISRIQNYRQTRPRPPVLLAKRVVRRDSALQLAVRTNTIIN